MDNSREEILIIADVLNIHPDPIMEGSVHEVTTDEIVKIMHRYATSCQSEREKELQSRITELEALNKELVKLIPKNDYSCKCQGSACYKINDAWICAKCNNPLPNLPITNQGKDPQ